MKRETEFLPKWTVYDDEPYPGPMEDDLITVDFVFKDDFTDPLRNLAAGLKYAANAYGSAWTAWVKKFAPDPEHDSRTCSICNPKVRYAKIPEIKLSDLGDIRAMNAYEPITLEFPPAKHAIQKPDLEAIRAKMNNGPKRDPFKHLDR